MIRLIYNLLFPLALLFFLPGYVVKMLRRGNYRHQFGQRFGLYDRALRARLAAQRHSWMHAVSVGEVMIALKLAAALKEREPKLRVALTTTTTTGFALARERASEWIEIIYTPLDFWPIMRRAFGVIRPLRIVLVEAEVWPNLAAIAQRRRIPLALVNARLSPRSERRFQKFKIFVRPFLQKLDLVCVPEAEDIARWQSLGVNPARIHQVGSIKFDPEDARTSPEVPGKVLQALGVDATRPILLGGSTHQGEEEILAKILLRLRQEFPALFLIIAPRHAERAREIAARLQSLGVHAALRSAAGKARSCDCMLLDTTGELRNWYSVATVVFIGKSLAARGGQNPVEAIIAGRPVIFGPHMENFAQLAQSLVEAKGALQITDEVALAVALAELLRDENKRTRLIMNAREVIARHRGATARTAELLTKARSAHA